MRLNTTARMGVTGFTLVEMLVVMGIIAALMGVLLPALNRARENARGVQCGSQLHSLGIALAAYASDSHGRLPAWSGWHVYPSGSSAEDEPGEAWTEQLAPYFALPDSPVYTCPSFGPAWITYFLSGRWAASQGRNWMRLSEIIKTSQFVLGGESTNRHLYAPPYGDALRRTTNDCDQDDAVSPCAVFPGESGGFLNHRGGNNLLFGDLHVAAHRKFDPSDMTFDPRAMRAWAEVPEAPVKAAVARWKTR